MGWSCAREGTSVGVRSSQAKFGGRVSARGSYVSQVRDEDDELAPEEPAWHLGHCSVRADGADRVEDVLQAGS
jgi:hypothetical protein